jgi:hypothetical protein
MMMEGRFGCHLEVWFLHFLNEIINYIIEYDSVDI